MLSNARNANMQNPWVELPKAAPYVLAADAPLLQAFNLRVMANRKSEDKNKYTYDTSLLPEPYFGSLSAPVVVLNLNPGWSPDDGAVHAQAAFASMCRRSLAHELQPYPFLHLQPERTTPGGEWWQRRTSELASEVGWEVVAKNLACIQFMPYHSEKYSTASPRLPSQEYSLDLVRRAMARGAEIVVMRAARLWMSAVPELGNYGRLHRAANPRGPFLSRGNLKCSYDVIRGRLQG